MKLPGYCACEAPARRVVEGILTCGDCGEPIADPLLLRLLAEVLAQRRQLAELERRLTEPKPAAPEWLAPKEVALPPGQKLQLRLPPRRRTRRRKSRRRTTAPPSLQGGFGFFRRL